MVEAFDAQQWVLRMGKELERVACDADPCFFPRNAPPPWGATKEQIREHEKRQYRDLACAARHDETAAKLFAKSSLGLNADHQDARIFIERLWRSLKYKAVYLHELRDGPDAGRCLPQRHGGSVNAAPSQVPGHALVNRRGREEAQDLSFRCALLRPQPSPGRRSGGSPTGDPGLSWHLCFPSTPRTSGWRICHERTHSECFRGLSRPVGIHLTYGVELSSEVGLPDSDLWHGGKYIESAINYRTPNRASGSM